MNYHGDLPLIHQQRKWNQDCESHNDIKDEEAALLFQDWNVD